LYPICSRSLRIATSVEEPLTPGLSIAVLFTAQDIENNYANLSFIYCLASSV
jgi:hypothetical protein